MLLLRYVYAGIYFRYEYVLDSNIILKYDYSAFMLKLFFLSLSTIDYAYLCVQINPLAIRNIIKVFLPPM